MRPGKSEAEVEARFYEAEGRDVS